MSIDLIKYRGYEYPALQAMAHMGQYVVPFASKFCVGKGYDIGCGKLEWCFPGAIPVDICLEDGLSAMSLPEKEVDYIFSSHCLEHLPDWVKAVEYWASKIRTGGILYLYLPDYSQEYWRPWNNRKHLHVMDREVVADCLKELGFHKVLYSGVDLACSFSVVGEKL